jgi:hypothetical protein
MTAVIGSAQIAVGRLGDIARRLDGRVHRRRIIVLRNALCRTDWCITVSATTRRRWLYDMVGGVIAQLNIFLYLSASCHIDWFGICKEVFCVIMMKRWSGNQKGLIWIMWGIVARYILCAYAFLRQCSLLCYRFHHLPQIFVNVDDVVGIGDLRIASQ